MKPWSVILFVFLLLHGSNASFAQTDSTISQPDTAVSTVTDSAVSDNGFTRQSSYIMDTVVEKQNISTSADSITAYKTRKEFAYVRIMDSLLKSSGKFKLDTININNIKFKRSKIASAEVPEPASTKSVFDNGFVKIFLWVIAISFILFVLYKLFLGEGMFRREPVNQDQQTIEEETTLEPSGYDKLVNEAILAGNFRLAVRYLYLQVLQNLSLKQVIQFSPDKTNYEYVRELSDKSYQNNFASITLNYEYVWYGHFDINENLFTRLHSDFKAFNNKI